MAQSDFGQIVPTTKSGSALAADLNNWRMLCIRGIAAPLGLATFRVE